MEDRARLTTIQPFLICAFAIKNRRNLSRCNKNPDSNLRYSRRFGLSRSPLLIATRMHTEFLVSCCKQAVAPASNRNEFAPLPEFQEPA